MYNYPTKVYFVYILTNKYHTVFYTGVTNNLENRITQHIKKSNKGFTEKYNISKLVYFEIHEDIETAIAQEKRIKKRKRIWKIELIEKHNPRWEDLYKKIIKW